jgi:hypothetical protein
MTVTRAIAATALFAGLAVGTASPVWAETTINGRYTWTSTTPTTGKSTSGDLYFTPCGDGCASAASTPGGPVVGQVRFVTGQWTMDGTWSVRCADGTLSAPEQYHDTWDPNTLAGTQTHLPIASHPAANQRGINRSTSCSSRRPTGARRVSNNTDAYSRSIPAT